MAAVPKHLQIINPSYGCGGECPLFGRFPMLPTELRLRIWQCSIKYHRLLAVDIGAPSGPGPLDTPLYSTRNALNKLISGRNYTATMRGKQLHSKLLRINHESRKVALQFYRVHIPLHFRTSENLFEPGTKATLYFNPEYDIIHFRTLQMPVEHTFVDFLHDFKAYDPQDIGLLNLALDTNAMNSLHSLTRISEIPARTTFVNSLSRLQQIIWMAESHGGRAIMGPMSDFRSVGVRFNHSMPVKSPRPRFDLLSRDPRPIGPELKYVLTGTYDPRQMRVWWRELLERWEIRQVRPTEERVLFAYKPYSFEEEVYNIKTGEEFLRQEADKWLKAQLRWHNVTLKYAGKIPVEGPEELAKATRPAIGFWLFPADALGDLEGNISKMKVVFDMTGHWPELALSYLS